MTRTLFPALAVASVASLGLAGLPARAAPVMPAVAMPAAPARAMPAAPFRHVAANGTTKPAGAALDARGGLTPALARRERELHRLVATAICRGC